MYNPQIKKQKPSKQAQPEKTRV
jgi:hypothetical protein